MMVKLLQAKYMKLKSKHCRLLAEKSIERLDGMKIDIEGYEEDVLIPFLKAPQDLLQSYRH